MAKVIETKLICNQAGCYIGWPTVGQGPDGVLYALFSGDRDGHAGMLKLEKPESIVFL